MATDFQPGEPRYKVALFNSSDVRGKKVGGIQTYMRDYIQYHPADMDLLVIGGDETGQLPLGEVTEVEFRGRKFKFLPLFHLDDINPNYAAGISGSDTFRFAKLMIKHWGKLRRILREGGYTAEVRRVEYAPILWSMGVKVITMVHIWGRKDQPMSSTLGKHWYIRDATEFTAAALSEKMYGVSTPMTEMFRQKYKPFARKFDTLTTWANPEIFKPSPYSFDDGLIHVIYAGRMDKFKRPDLMFRTMAALNRLHPGGARFHYVGNGDVESFPEFEAARDITVRHGILTSEQIGALMNSMHLGILTSDFEGMPCIVMETLSAGRPVVARHLPQLEDVIHDGSSGWLVPTDKDVEVQAQRMIEVYEAMRAGSVTPDGVAKAVEPFSLTELLGKIWKDHRVLHGLKA